MTPHDLYARGLSIIPVPRPGGGHDGKRPTIAWRAYQQRRPTIEELDAWFSAPMNLAIVTGAVSGIVAVDLDAPSAARWWTRHRPYSPWQTQTARGWHVFYRHPGSRVPNRAHVETPEGRTAIDVRGDGGYVIGPGSVHASGHVYTAVGDWTRPITDLPVYWPGWAARPARPAVRPVHRPSADRDVLDRARAYLAAVPVPVIGMGSDAATLYAACRLVRGFALSAADAEDLLWAWAGGRAGWTRDWIARKVQHAERYGTEPIGGLRA